MLTVYSKKNCPFCDQAKALLTKKSIAFEEVRVDLDDSAKEFIMSAGHRTVPQIYQAGRLFVESGYTGLTRLTDLDFTRLLKEENVSN